MTLVLMLALAAPAPPSPAPPPQPHGATAARPDAGADAATPPSLALSRRTTRALSRTGVGLTGEPLPGGGHKVALGERFQSVLFATVGDDRQLRIGHRIPAPSRGHDRDEPGLATARARQRIATGRAHSTGTTVTVLSDDPPDRGFNDPAPVDPIPGNPATTRGGQARNAFLAAAEWWGERLVSGVEIVIDASFEPLECDEHRAVLALLGNVALVRDFAPAPGQLEPHPATWYPVPLANSIARVDLDPAAPDLTAAVNSDVGTAGCLPEATLSFATDDSSPAGTISLFDLVRHTLAHGLGFMTYADLTTGELFSGDDGEPRPDAFVRHLEDHSLGLGWLELTAAERLASAADTGDLHWTGERATAAADSSLGSGPGDRSLTGGVDRGHLVLYAPDPIERELSVSHWDTTLAPNELMEPFLTDDASDLVTTSLFEDLGWRLSDAGPPPPDPSDPDGPDRCRPDETTLCLGAEERFSARLEVVDPHGPLSARTVPLADVSDSGLFYYRDPNNLEMLLKVLDACELAGHFWVLYAATTDVELELTVRDLRSGIDKRYRNLAGEPAAAVIDSRAFPCAAEEDPPPTGLSALAQREKNLGPQRGGAAGFGFETPPTAPVEIGLAGGAVPGDDRPPRSSPSAASAIELAARPLSQDAIELRWRDPSPSATGTRVLEMRQGGGFIELATPATGANRLELAGLRRHGPPGTRFLFRLRTDRAGAASLYSPETAVRTFRQPPCSPSPTVLCLHEGRFEVQIEWRDFDDRTGRGQVTRIPGAELSAVEWFIVPDNLEVLIKILDGCSLNGHWWVFFAATTNVEFSTTVFDRLSGERRDYFNRLGRLAPAVTDTAAFATCP